MLRNFPYIVQCNQYDASATFVLPQCRERLVPFYQVFGTSRNIQHVPDGGVFLRAQTLAGPVPGQWERKCRHAHILLDNFHRDCPWQASGLLPVDTTVMATQNTSLDRTLKIRLTLKADNDTRLSI